VLRGVSSLDVMSSEFSGTAVLTGDNWCDALGLIGYYQYRGRSRSRLVAPREWADDTLTREIRGYGLADKSAIRCSKVVSLI
jgi:hypothetical protein